MNKDLEKKIIFLFEKISQISRSLMWETGFTNKLSPLQIQIISFLVEKPEFKSGVKEISQELGVTMPTISDAVTVLLRKKFIKMVQSRSDRRYRNIYLTELGEKFYREKIMMVKTRIEEGLNILKKEDKKNLFIFLLKILSEFQEKGLLQVARICPNCQNFVMDKYPGTGKPHFCRLTSKRLAEYELKVNCAENIPRNKF